MKIIWSFINIFLMGAILVFCSDASEGHLRPTSVIDRGYQKNQDAAKLYADSIEFFKALKFTDACKKMREFLKQDQRYGLVEGKLTDNDIDDIIQSQIRPAVVLSTGCFIEHVIYQITISHIMPREQLDGYLFKQYGVGLNGLITLDEAAVENQNIRRKLEEDLSRWGFQGLPTRLGGGLPLDTGRVLRQIAGRPLIGTEDGPIKVMAFGKVGNDEAGRAVKSELGDKWGVDVSGLINTDEAPTERSYVLSFGTYGRTFIKLGASNANRKLNIKDIPDDAIRRADVMHIGGSVLTPQLMKELPEFLKKAKTINPKVKIIIDTTLDQHKIWNEVFEKDKGAYSYIDVLSVSYLEAVSITDLRGVDDILSFFLARGVGEVYLKQGAEGSYAGYIDEYTKRSMKFYIPALQGLNEGATVWEEAGAGDSFTAGLIYGITHNWSRRKASLFATVLGGMTCRYVGGTIEKENIVDAIANKRELTRQIRTSKKPIRDSTYPREIRRHADGPVVISSLETKAGLSAI